MKPLTIEKLRNLDMGDWVWVITEHYSRYVWIFNTEGECLHYQYSDIENRVLTLSYSDYGAKWLAYKNKEQAENEICCMFRSGQCHLSSHKNCVHRDGHDDMKCTTKGVISSITRIAR